MKEFYITDKAGNYIEDIDEAINNSLEEIKNCYQSAKPFGKQGQSPFHGFRKVKIFKHRIKTECKYKKRTKEEVKTSKIFFNTDYIMNNAIFEYGEFKQWLDFEKERYERYGHEFEFLGLRKVQINIEPTKASFGSYIDLPPISKTLNQK